MNRGVCSLSILFRGKGVCIICKRAAVGLIRLGASLDKVIPKAREIVVPSNRTVNRNGRLCGVSKGCCVIGTSGKQVRYTESRRVCNPCRAIIVDSHRAVKARHT